LFRKRESNFYVAVIQSAVKLVKPDQNAGKGNPNKSEQQPVDTSK